MLLVSATMINVGLASPETLIYTDPAVFTGSQLVEVWVDDAPNTIAWELYVRWDPNTLDLQFLVEGNFLARGMYGTNFIYTPVAQANIEGEILIGCLLTGPGDPWANGTGWMCTLAFTVDTGAVGSTLVDLFDTVLFDHLVGGLPAPTPYPNEDSFFYNADPSHDLRITDITAPSSLTMGDIAYVSVTVLNEGTETENFTITVYADGTTIGTETVLNLPGAGNSEDRSFTCDVLMDTTAEGTFTISATAGPVAGEVDTGDNSFTDGTVTVVRPDLWVLAVIPFAPEVKIGQMLTIGVMVMNLGPTPQTFDIVILANGIPVSSHSAIYGSLATLPGGLKKLFFVPWVTALSPPPAGPGTYTIAGLVPGVTHETNLGPPFVPPPYVGLWDNGTYYDNDGSENVTVGDLRLSPVYVGGITYPPYTPVLPGDLDLGIPLMIYGRNMLTDGSVVLTNAEAELYEWKLKVNGKAGVGIGHKSMVGAANTLEAWAINTGPADVLVRAMFEIKDAVGTVIAEVWSNVGFMPVGQTTIVSGSWTASFPGVFYVTAYLFYGTAFPIIPGGFSRTQTLRVDVPPH